MCIKLPFFVWKWPSFLLAWQHNRCLVTKCVTVLQEHVHCSLDMATPEMHSLQNFLSFEYKCSIFLLLKCSVYWLYSKITLMWGEIGINHFISIWNLALQNQPIRIHPQIWNICPLKSSNHISAFHYGFLASQFTH